MLIRTDLKDVLRNKKNKEQIGICSMLSVVFKKKKRERERERNGQVWWLMPVALALGEAEESLETRNLKTSLD